MAEGTANGAGKPVFESGGETGRVNAVKDRIAFVRANKDAADAAFGDRSTPIGSPRKARGIPANKKATVTVSDTEPNKDKKVKGSPPKEEPKEVEAKTNTRTRSRSGKIYPGIEDSRNQAQFILSALEVVSVTAVGPTGEMTEWERGFIQAPLQRIIRRIPIDYLNKGGLIFDIGFLSMGMAIYSMRIGRGHKLPQFGKAKKTEVAQDDLAAPVAAAPAVTVNTTRAGDKDGLAVPVPSVIGQWMNGAV